MKYLNFNSEKELIFILNASIRKWDMFECKNPTECVKNEIRRENERNKI